MELSKNDYASNLAQKWRETSTALCRRMPLAVLVDRWQIIKF